MNMKKILIFTLILAFSLGLVFSVGAEEAEITPSEEEYIEHRPEPELQSTTSFEKAKIISIEDKSEVFETEEGERIEAYREIGVKMLSGAHEGEETFFKDSPQTNPFGMEFEIGQKLLLYIEDMGDGNWTVSIDSFYRVPELLWLIVIFFIFLIILGGVRKGLKTILSLVVAVILIFKVLVPAILSGYSALLITFILALVISAITLILVGGRNKKSYAAILGTLGGVIVAFIISFLFAKAASLIGLSTEEGRLLASTNPDIDPRGIFLSGILVGALGAAMDVAIGVASAVKEVSDANQGSGLKKLFKSGMNVGRDVIGTMSNTLIFAYVGAALPTILLFQQLGESWLKFLNFNFIADEVVRSVGGSIGLVAVIPLTALIAAYFYRKKEEKSVKPTLPEGIIRRSIDKK